ncbi:hypothetical protein E2C01_066951 [Portunus trituberculatus]|uniref:Uncharacterized protein n=1 Tax=Portunus trituberculatus TaxID=210409 RepID=A0A5B7HJL2_PORTR|nr:hypothetical protein [Portunus trituberculatus]
MRLVLCRCSAGGATSPAPLNSCTSWTSAPGTPSGKFSS